MKFLKEVAVALLKNVEPNYNVMDKIPRDLGRYHCGIGEYWEWENFDTSTSHTTMELFKLYRLCKNSWKT